MNFSTDDDDGDFGFSAGPGSKLSSLFGMDKTSNQGGNESLTFTAPKQPKKSKDQQQQQQPQQTQGQGGQSALLLAVAVHAYRFSNGTYIKHGKLGAAILGNHTANDYKILLYISKQQQVTHARISPTFAFTVQANNYATFYDEQRQNWSIMFESEQNAIDFAKQVGLAKVNSAGSASKSLVFQDLTIGLGDAVQSGDSVEVKYTGWLYSSRSFGDVFDSNTSVDKPFRFKIGKGKVIKGWEEGVVGMKKNGRRLLIVPPPLAYGKKGLGSRIPPNSTLLFDVEIKKLKFSRDKEESGSLSSDATDGLRSEERVGSPKVGRSRGGDVSSDNESRIKHNNNSESQLSTSPSSSKAKLISRMAKMGQPMLPLAGGVVAHDSTDSEADEASASDTGGMSPSGHPNMMAKKAMKVPKKMHNNHTNNFQSDMGHGMHNQLPRPGDPGVHQVAIYNPQSAQHNQSQPMPPGQGHLGHQAQAGGMGMQHGQQPLPNYPLHQQQQQQSQQQHTYYQPPQHIPSQNQGQNPMQQHQMAPYPNLANQQALVTQQQMTDMQMVPIVLSEARQHHSDIRSAVGKVSDRIDDLCKKVNDIQPTPSQPALPSNQAMEATVLMSNISRIVQENERLKDEVYDKNTRIEKQNNKISELLQKNQLYVEQSNSLMEKTNDSFKLTATQSQQRVLELEQEKVQMTSELTNATSKISSLQMELSNVQQREGQLRAQLNGAINNKHENLGELDQLRQQLKDNDNKYTEVLKALKDERQLKKQLENKVTTMEEELSEMKMERDSIEKNLLERKRKAAAEKQKSEEDIDDIKRSFEDEILQLKSKIRHQKTSTDAATAEQVSQVERELETQWRERSDRLLLQAKEKHEREMEDARDEKEQIKRKLAATETKMLNVRANDDNKDEVEGLQKQVQEMEVWKEKYDSLHSSAVSMKERYETRIKELIQEKAAAAASSATIAPAPTNIVDEVKKVMNNVYHSLRGEIDTSENYKGNEVLNIIMNTIKMMMIKVMKEAAKKGDQEEGDDEEESEEEEEEEEEEEDDEEEEEEEVPVKAPVKETVAKKETAVPVMSAPPSGSPAPPAVQSTSPPPTIVIEEVVQREDEQVVESARQPEEEEVKEEEEEEEQKREEEKDEIDSSDVAPVEISTEPTKVAVDQGGEVQDEEKEVEEQREEDDTDGGLRDSTMVADNNANDQQEEEEEEEQEEEREEEQGEDDADDEESLKDSKKDEDDDFWSAEGSDAEEEVEKPSVMEPSGPPKIPPELPPGLPPTQEEDAGYLDTGDKPRALSNIPDLPADLDVGVEEKQEEIEEEDDDDEPDPFAPPEPPPAEEEPEDDDQEEEEEEEEEKSADTGPLPTVLDREPPELPPELPQEDEEDTSKKTKTKKEDISSGIFGDDDDDDGLFSIPISSTKKAAKKKPTPAKTTVKPAEDDDPFKPGPPPPLFGDDDDDDLDWIS